LWKQRSTFAFPVYSPLQARLSILQTQMTSENHRKTCYETGCV